MTISVFIILGTYKRWIFNIFPLAQRILILIFRCHTVTHGTNLRRSPQPLDPLPRTQTGTLWHLFSGKIMQMPVCTWTFLLKIGATNHPGKGLDPPPPPNGQCPNEQRFSFGGASLIFGYLNCQRTTKGSLDVYGFAFFRGGRGVFQNFYFWKICFDGRSGW